MHPVAAVVALSIGLDIMGRGQGEGKGRRIFMV